jgi:hypothetical protein
MVWRWTILLSLPVSLLLDLKGCVITAEIAMSVSFVNNSALRSASFPGLIVKRKKNQRIIIIIIIII